MYEVVTYRHVNTGDDVRIVSGPRETATNARDIHTAAEKLILDWPLVAILKGGQGVGFYENGTWHMGTRQSPNPTPHLQETNR